MVHKTQRHPRRTEQEWMDIIQECRASGMSDKAWCDQHHIPHSNFYYHIRKFRARACAIPETSVSPFREKQDVVQIQDSTTQPFHIYTPDMGNTLEADSETVIRLTFHGFHVEITNTAASETIINTIAALQSTC